MHIPFRGVQVRLQVNHRACRPTRFATVLARWLQGWHATPSVDHIATNINPAGPTALEFLQHHTTKLPKALLHKLFSQRVVRRYHKGKVCHQSARKPRAATINNNLRLPQ